MCTFDGHYEEVCATKMSQMCVWLKLFPALGWTRVHKIFCMGEWSKSCQTWCWLHLKEGLSTVNDEKGKVAFKAAILSQIFHGNCSQTKPVVTSMPEPEVDVADVYSSWGAADGFPSMDSWFPLSGDKWVKITIFFIFMTLLQILRHLSIFMLCSNQPASRQTNLTSAKKGVPTCQFGERFKMKHFKEYCWGIYYWQLA